MAVLQCPECKSRVSDQTEFCQNCGYPIKNVIVTSYGDLVKEEDRKIQIAKSKYEKEYGKIEKWEQEELAKLEPPKNLSLEEKIQFYHIQMPPKPEEPQKPYSDIMTTKPLTDEDYEHRISNIDKKQKTAKKYRHISMYCIGFTLIITLLLTVDGVDKYKTFQQAFTREFGLPLILVMDVIGFLMLLVSQNAISMNTKHKQNLTKRKSDYKRELTQRAKLQQEYQHKMNVYRNQLNTYNTANNNFPAYVDQKAELVQQDLQPIIRKRKFEIEKEKHQKEFEIAGYENDYIEAYINKMLKIAKEKIININDNFFICNINGVSYNLISFYARIFNDSKDVVASDLSKFTDIPYEEALNLIDSTKTSGIIPQEISCQSLTAQKESIEAQDRIAQNQLRLQQQKLAEEEEKRLLHQTKCPRCGSTDIGIIRRGYDWLFMGWIGANKPYDVCKKCGYKWRAGY